MSSPAHRRVTLPDDVAHTPVGSSAFRLGWLAIVVITAAWHLYTASRWSWFQDDLLYTSQTAHLGFADYLFRPIADHFAPGTLLFVWVGAMLSPLNYAWAVFTGTLLAVAATVAWGLALRELFGEKTQVLAGLVLISITPSLLMDSLFWTRGLGTYSALLVMGLCVWFLARLHVRGGTTRDLVLLTLTYAVGLFVWHKILLVTIPLLFLTLLLGPTDLRGAVRHAVRRLWSVALVTAIYIPVFLLATKDSSSEAPGDAIPRTVGSFFSFLASGTMDIALPSMIGGPFGRPDHVGGFFPEAPGALALGLLAVTALLVLVGVRYRRRGWLALAMVVTYALIAWGLVFLSNRWPLTGEALIRSPHYTADLLPVMVLASLFLLNRTVLDDDRPLLRPVPAAALTWVKRGAVGYVALVCVAATITTGRTWDTVQPQSSKPYFDALLAGARDLGAADVYDTRVPNAFVSAAYFDEGSRISDVLGPLDLPLRYDQPTERYAVVDEATGEFRAASVVDGVVNAGALPTENCGYAVEQGEVVEIPLDGGLFAWAWIMELTYFSEGEARVSVRTDDDLVELELTATDPGDIGRRQATIGGAVSSLSIEGLEGVGTVCVTGVRIGNIAASDEAPPRPEKDGS